MNRYSNYHTHTSFCDGADSPEAIVEEALRLGCPEIGFSGHSYLREDSCSMSPKKTAEYREEIMRLKTKYAGRIQIYLGIEQDYYSEKTQYPWDYIIGSVHYVQHDGAMYAVDESRDSFLKAVQTAYMGDYYAFAEEYYAIVADVYRKTGCSVIGHFDLITKYNEGNILFDTGHPRYRAAAERALDELMKTDAVLEINTGVIIRGYRRTPYPEPWILSRWMEAGKPIILSSDCHDMRYLLYCFEEAERLVTKPALLHLRLPINNSFGENHGSD